MKKEGVFINGKEISYKIAEKLRSNFSAINEKRIKKGMKKVSLGVFLIGGDKVIESFVKIKKRLAEKVDVEFKLFSYGENILEKDFIEDFDKKQKEVDGVIIQLPLPKNFNTEKILQKIDVKKDVDFLNPTNTVNGIYAPVSGAIFKIIQMTDFDLKNKKIVIVGNGFLTGKPFVEDLKKKKFEKEKDFFMIDSKTSEKKKKELLKNADLIISGVGISNLIKKEDIKDGVFLIDAGTSTANKKLEGDISLNCVEKAKYFSKTPGGIGPLTVAVLYENLLELINK